MLDPTSLSLRETVCCMRNAELNAETVVQAYAERIGSVEPMIRAWAYFDRTQALAAARRADASGAARSGLLGGIPVGVKDLMDTEDMPTSYGSPIYEGHQPRTDAACVAACRIEGAVIMGKTVTTEFATFHPGPTRNPHGSVEMPRTPGGSSSGSAAAVAAGMVPVAFGTQTAGSIVRPAAYCGVVGFKPTFGTLPTAGVKPLAPSLDTIGVLARTVDDATYFVSALSRQPWGDEIHLAGQRPLRVGVCRTPHWDRISVQASDAFEDAVRIFVAEGMQTGELNLPQGWEDLTQAQIDIMAAEARAAFAPEFRTQSGRFSVAFSDFLASAEMVDADRLQRARALARRAQCESEMLFSRYDVLLVPSAEGPAPSGLEATGNPIYNRMWTLLGLPCVHVPTMRVCGNLPVGVTLVGPWGRDGMALMAALLLERAVAHAGRR